ncbi:MAG: hypothetical protein O3A78_06790 [Nitrospinae bacterium]|jgi:hypothetical protein|nr:hypothetical protein [Nitrospinota bacterium]MDA1109508.1 hypothetical protein [Nitrospinota bacterium]
MADWNLKTIQSGAILFTLGRAGCNILGFPGQKMARTKLDNE